MTMSNRTDRRRWNTYLVRGYTYDAAEDAASQGGVHLHQVRCIEGQWMQRIEQSNGNRTAYGPVTPIGEAEGMRAFETAKQEAL